MYINDDDADLLHEKTEQFWLDFSTLVNDTLASVPEHLRDELEMRLGDKTSVYGRNS